MRDPIQAAVQIDLRVLYAWFRYYVEQSSAVLLPLEFRTVPPRQNLPGGGHRRFQTAHGVLKTEWTSHYERNPVGHGRYIADAGWLRCPLLHLRRCMDN